MHTRSRDQVDHQECAVLRFGNDPSPMNDVAGKPGVSIVFGVDHTRPEIHSMYPSLSMPGPQKRAANHRLVLFIDAHGRVRPCSAHGGPPLRMAVVATGTGIANYVVTILTDRHSQRVGVAVCGNG